MKIKEVCHRNFLKDPDHFSMHWALTNNCNYKCNYCGVWKDEEIYPHMKAVEYINHINNHKNVDTVLFGGEPLIHPNILQITADLESDIRICTNLGRSLRFLEELSSVNSNLKIIASLHLHKADLIEFANKIEFACKNFKFVKLKIKYDPTVKLQSKKVWEYFKAYEKLYDNMKVYLDMVYHPDFPITKGDLKFFDSQQNDDRFYIRTEEIDKFLSYNEIRRMFDGFPNYYGYQCYCGKSGLFINSNGDVSYCQTKKNKGQIIFNINNIDDYTDYDYLLINPIICDMNEPCYEVVIPRRSND